MRSKLIPVGKNPTTFYKPYPYFDVSTASPTNEYLTRARRTIAFADTTDLAPLKATSTNEKLVRNLFGDVSKVMHTDHVSAWKSLLGTLFLLNEPYDSKVSQNFGQTLADKGFIYAIVPTDLSPYCGKWDGTPGTLPCTKSILICDQAHWRELNAIANALDVVSKIAPAWDFVQEVSL